MAFDFKKAWKGPPKSRARPERRVEDYQVPTMAAGPQLPEMMFEMPGPDYLAKENDDTSWDIVSPRGEVVHRHRDFLRDNGVQDRLATVREHYERSQGEAQERAHDCPSCHNLKEI